MTCRCDPFEETLHYSSPAHGGWGVVRMGHMMPESYQLFVSPFACGRHGAIGAYLQGRKNRVSYLYIDERDIVSGGYEELILDAVDELLETLAERRRTPKVLMIFVSCLDDLLGTDHRALTDELSSRHPDVRFVFCHMNPISADGKLPPAVNIQDKLYSLLDRRNERNETVNFIGNLVNIRPNCEIFRFLDALGVEKALHITDFATFEEFQSMASSRLNLVLAPPGLYASRQMEKKHAIPYIQSFVSYDMEEIAATYGKIAEALGAEGMPDMSEERAESLQAIASALDRLRNRPVVLDGDAITRPFAFTRAMLGYGFHIPLVIAQDVIPSDKESYEWLRSHRPDIQIIQPQHHRSVLFETRIPECLSIGYNSAYITGSSHVVDVDTHDGLFGYRGLCEMMDMMTKAADRTCDLREIIDNAGLVV